MHPSDERKEMQSERIMQIRCWNITNYYTKAETNNLFTPYYDSGEVDGLFTSYYTKVETDGLFTPY